MKLVSCRLKPKGRAFACLLAILAACDSVNDDSQQRLEANSEGAPHARAADVDTLAIDPARIIGRVSGDPEYLFGSIVSLASDGDGRLYVGDGIDVSVRVFGRDGTFLGWIAREGGGPGEVVQRPADLVVGRDGRLHVRDARRITVFTKPPDGSIPDSVAAVWSTPGLGNTTSARSAVARDGRYFYPGGHYPRSQLPRYYYASYTQGSLDGDTLDVPPFPGLRSVPPAVFSLGGDGLILRGLNRVPFSPVPIWAMTPDGTLLSSDGASSTLLETNAAGDTVRTIRLPNMGPRPIPADERRDSLAALEERIAEARELIARFQGRLSQVTRLGEGVEERRLPESLPAVIGLSVAENGWIWIERWPAEGQQDARYYDVLNPTGAFRHVVVLRAPLVRDPSPWFGEDFVVGVVRDPDTDVERVVRFDLP